MKKVVLDQVFLTLPILFIFFTAMSYWEGKQDITAEFREKIVKTYAVIIHIILCLLFDLTEYRTFITHKITNKQYGKGL